jgi:hypothetical protein
MLSPALKAVELFNVEEELAKRLAIYLVWVGHPRPQSGTEFVAEAAMGKLFSFIEVEKWVKANSWVKGFEKAVQGVTSLREEIHALAKQIVQLTESMSEKVTNLKPDYYDVVVWRNFLINPNKPLIHVPDLALPLCKPMESVVGFPKAVFQFNG